MKTIKTIERKYLILCEGRDEEKFLVRYINSSERISDDKRFDTEVQVIDFGGNENLQAFLKILPATPGFNNVKSILIIRDAEKSAKRAVAQVKSAIKNAGLLVPDNPCEWKKADQYAIAFLLFPSLSKDIKDGTLEHLCMKMIDEKYNPNIVLDEFANVMDSLENNNIRVFPHDFKSKLHGFFSLTDDFVGLKIGEAADAGAFDWSSSELDNMNKLIISGFDIMN